MSAGAGRVLAIDLGAVRIGLALSDPIGMIAQPLSALERTAKASDLRELGRLVREYEIKKAVVGLPLLLSGKEGSAAAGARAFAAELRAEVCDLDVALWDERLTTREVERMLIEADVKRGRRKRIVDSLAATLILQSYLDARPREDGLGQ